MNYRKFTTAVVVALCLCQATWAAGELSLATGVQGQTVECHIYFGATRYNGSAGNMSATTDINNGVWDDNITSVAELLTGDGAIQTGLYVADMPDTGQTGIHHIVYFVGGTGTLGRRHTAIQAYDNSRLTNATWTDTRAGYLDALNGHTAQTGDSYAIVNSGTFGNSALKTLIDDIPTTAEFEARTLLAASYFDWTSDTVARVTLADTVTSLTNKSGSGLADNAITSAKYDETTAFPVKSADTGSTQIARVGADGDTLETLSDQIDAIVPNFGSGARTVTFTVDDGSDPLEDATVRVTKGAASLSGTTNASGQINSGSGFALDDGTWTVAITLPGYSYTPTPLVVSANSAQTPSMTAVTITASNPDRVTGYFTCFDENGVAAAGVVVKVRFDSINNDTGIAYDTAERTATSNESGVAEFTNMMPGATFRFKRGIGPERSVTIAADAESPVQLGSIWGVDE